MTVTTRVRLMSCNFRLEPMPEDIAAGRGWPVRKQPTIDLLKQWQPSIICGQECSTNIRQSLAVGLGANWKFVRNGNVIVWYATTVHTLISSKTAMLPTPTQTDGTPGDPRRLVLVQLQTKKTGDKWWAAATHFTAGGDPTWRIKQMQAVCEFIKANGDLTNTILGADINSSLMDDEGPRTVARDAGLYDLRSKLAAARIRNVTATTFPGWVEPSPQNSRWIDDYFSGENFQPYYGRVVETNGASDHNYLIGSSIQLS